jgi:hypothetical protein
LAQYYGGLVGDYRRRRRYTRAEQIEKLAVEKCRKNGKGITFNDFTLDWPPIRSKVRLP